VFFDHPNKPEETGEGQADLDEGEESGEDVVSENNGEIGGEEQENNDAAYDKSTHDQRVRLLEAEKARREEELLQEVAREVERVRQRKERELAEAEGGGR